MRFCPFGSIISLQKKQPFIGPLFLKDWAHSLLLFIPTASLLSCTTMLSGTFVNIQVCGTFFLSLFLLFSERTNSLTPKGLSSRKDWWCHLRYEMFEECVEQLGFYPSQENQDEECDSDIVLRVADFRSEPQVLGILNQGGIDLEITAEPHQQNRGFDFCSSFQFFFSFFFLIF